MNYKNYLLEGEISERLTYRKVLYSDFDIWKKFCKYPDSLKYIMPNEKGSGEEKCKKWFDRVFDRYENNKGGMNALINTETGEYIGQCGLLVQTVQDVQELEIGYSIMPEFRNKGYACEAAKKCKEYAFKNNFSDSLISIVDVENIYSAKVATSNGMYLDKEIIYTDGALVYIFRITKEMYFQK